MHADIYPWHHRAWPGLTQTDPVACVALQGSQGAPPLAFMTANQDSEGAEDCLRDRAEDGGWTGASWRQVAVGGDWSRSSAVEGTNYACGCLPTAAILDDPMECSRGERLSITLAKNRINRAPERLGKAKVEVDIFELLRDSEYETAETST